MPKIFDVNDLLSINYNFTRKFCTTYTGYPNPGQDAAPPDGEPVITHLDVMDRFKEKEKAI